MTGVQTCALPILVLQSDRGNESLRRLWRRPRLLGLAGFKPALNEITGRSNAEAGEVDPRRCPSPRLRGLDEHDAFGCLSRGRHLDELNAPDSFGEA